mgnify:CR=1 FL=1
MVLNVFLAILVLSIIVIVHEFGHFIIAKANGITVVEFSIGFGPKLIHFRKGETEYCIKALPFGGACKIMTKSLRMKKKKLRKESLLSRMVMIWKSHLQANRFGQGLLL